MTKMFLQKGRTQHGLVLTAQAQAVVNGVADKSTLKKWGKGQTGATPNVKVVPATVKDLKPTQAELNPEILTPKDPEPVKSVEPTEKPVEPTENPVEPTEKPVEKHEAHEAEAKKSKKKH